MHRFFVNKKIENNYFELDDKLINHIKVARLEKDIFLCNYLNEFYECVFENQKAKIIRKKNINNEFKNEIILAAPIIKIERFEWLIQKAVELGATKIIPLISKYTNGNLVKYDLERKYKRFLEIIKNAAEQSFRNIIPSFEKPMQFKDIINKYNDKNIYIAHEKEAENKINFLETNCLILVGPEGGFSDEEITFATINKAKIVNLGKRILRAETACLFMLSNIKEI
ncbi:Ribosomal RNA small subunit methyltransferase [Mycoplasmopsis meleagridis]|uniref:Ribosomal RNA small subunit methyltransferase E n=1 Tax=Mycoplasmopsis meleagridis ATCC 25294 TaxID=1264554 RepID=A0A0F5H101_9BACT|nr:16S rRNA (uracil(1498)-N(3))-methyltransferase [Mycoplasmopsis meleagridis]KKB27006.1 Ribosomal RNA small subunit methyltransferase E [Mycoplasmopsis meleagridis ATCC 25294]KUH47295.1 16S rRNA methyltransferase [Mycoplasmopsis meleagridis]OAD18353.1 Ribosomal RNA small subunit methyltransferase [Mycoplasmopsis meleagridis]VEU77483.1 RsmE family RNA methyltransferase [Mycoplasmopsis meleagridis]